MMDNNENKKQIEECHSKHEHVAKSLAECKTLFPMPESRGTENQESYEKNTIKYTGLQPTEQEIPAEQPKAGDDAFVDAKEYGNFDVKKPTVAGNYTSYATTVGINSSSKYLNAYSKTASANAQSSWEDDIPSTSAAALEALYRKQALESMYKKMRNFGDDGYFEEVNHPEEYSHAYEGNSDDD